MAEFFVKLIVDSFMSNRVKDLTKNTILVILWQMR